MTINEALYVLEHRNEYPDKMVLWAMDIVDNARRQGNLD